MTKAKHIRSNAVQDKGFLKLFTRQKNTAEMSQPSEPSVSSSALETMDRFLQDESNLIVQLLVSLETKTNVSRRFLARGLLLILAGYFILSSSVIDLMSSLVMFVYPSYFTYRLLKQANPCQEDMIHCLKFWSIVGLFTTIDTLFGYFVPFRSIFKFFLVVQFVLPQSSASVDFATSHFVNPLFSHIEQNVHVRNMFQYLQTLSINVPHSHQD